VAGPPAPEDGTEAGADVVPFPQARVRPAGATQPFKVLGLSHLAQRIGAPTSQMTGHWCSRCKGIWYGYPLEVDCPVCGNRHG
jgi:hypothetical protein